MHTIHLKGDFATETLGEINLLFGQDTILIDDHDSTGVTITHSIDEGDITLTGGDTEDRRRGFITPVELNEVFLRNTDHLEVHENVGIEQRGRRMPPA